MQFKKIFLLYHSVKYMRYEQLLWRIFFLNKKRVFKRLRFLTGIIYSDCKNVELNNDYRFFVGREILDKCTEHIKYDEYFHKTGIFRIIENNEFSFLNKTVSFCGEIDWQSKEQARLWLYNLHYFDYAFELGLANVLKKDDVFFKTFKRLAVDWIDKNSVVGYGHGWEPYPLSLRIVNWIYAYSLFCDHLKGDKEFELKFIKSLAVQTECLNNNIEHHVSRNHLIKNGKALFLAGMFFDGDCAIKWRDKGFDILINGVDEQVLDDGGHYERSPMYHLIVLQDYLEVFILAERNNIDFAVNDKLLKMLRFLVNILHPDNQIPLFNDSAFGIAKEPGEILNIGAFALKKISEFSAKLTTSLFTALVTGSSGGSEYGNKGAKQLDALKFEPAILFESSGFCVIRNKENDKYFMIGCKDPGPFHQPGHSHSDIFSYELSLKNRRFIVDSGVNSYASGEWRDYFRSSRAHNTVTVDGHNQSELWGTFGVARRAFEPTTSLYTDEQNNVFFEGVFKGFPNRPGIVHRRNVFFIDESFWIVFDVISGGYDNKESYNIENLIHVHPERVVETVTKPDKTKGFVISDEDARLHVLPVNVSPELNINSETQVIKGDNGAIQGWYSPEFGKMHENSVIAFSRKGVLPVYTGYLLFPLTLAGKSDTISALCRFETKNGQNLKNGIFNFEINTPEYSYLIVKDGTEIRVEKRSQTRE